MRRLAILMTLGLAVPAQAQFVDPREKIREIIDEVAGEMQEIDRLLLQTGANREAGAKAAEAMKRNVERVEKLLDQSRSSQGKVVERIDELLDEIQKMAQQGGT